MTIHLRPHDGLAAHKTLTSSRRAGGIPECGIRFRQLVLLAAGVITLWSLSSCDSDGARGESGSSALIRDSLGVVIVENSTPAQAGNEWVVSPDPTLVIGAAEGDASSLFFQVAGVVRLSNGLIVVVDGATNELRYFDEAGKHLRTTGGSGDGPGEFRNAGSIIEVRADSAVIFDHFAARISVFGPDGTFGRSIPLRQPFGVTLGWVAFGSNPEGALLLRGMVQTPPAGFGPDVVAGPIFIADPESTEMVQHSVVPIAVLATDPQGRPRPTFPNAVSTPPAVTEHGYWIAVPGGAELLHVGWNGSISRIARFMESGGNLGPDDVERILRWQRDLTAGLPEEVLSTMAEPAVLPRLPMFANLIVDSKDYLWVQEARPDRDPHTWEFAVPRGSSRWRIIAPDGVWLGSLDLPDGFQPHSVGHDYVLGVWKNDDGVEFVHMYTLIRN